MYRPIGIYAHIANHVYLGISSSYTVFHLQRNICSYNLVAYLMGSLSSF